MRVIKFRAWDKEEKSWVPSGIMLELVIGKDLSQENDRFELMQYIGVNDKNGKEIYEGDVLEVDDYWRTLNVVVELEEGVFFPFGDPDQSPRPEQVEIIGNIYENPELLRMIMLEKMRIDELNKSIGNQG